jgi:hypothetical protein
MNNRDFLIRYNVKYSYRACACPRVGGIVGWVALGPSIRGWRFLDCHLLAGVVPQQVQISGVPQALCAWPGFAGPHRYAGVGCVAAPQKPTCAGGFTGFLEGPT